MTAALTDSGGAVVRLEVWLQNAEQVLLRRWGQLGASVFKYIIKTLIRLG